MNLQPAAGLCLVALGVIAFVDRNRPQQAHSRYFLVLPNFGPIAQALIGIIFAVLGSVLLFTA
jgi:hypothetical protein